MPNMRHSFCILVVDIPMAVQSQELSRGRRMPCGLRLGVHRQVTEVVNLWVWRICIYQPHINEPLNRLATGVILRKTVYNDINTVCSCSRRRKFMANSDIQIYVVLLFLAHLLYKSWNP